MTRRPVSQSHCAPFNALQEAGAIEPSVGHGLHNLREPFGLNPLQEPLAQRHIGAWKRLATDERDIPRLSDILHAAGLNHQKPGPPGHGLDKRGAGSGSVVLSLEVFIAIGMERWEV